ncbi:MAG: hypothetical protein AB7C91_03425 [Sphaerochaeta sp.]
MQETPKLPVWYDRMISSVPLMLLFVFAVLLCSPLLLLYGSLSVLFRK